MSHRGKLKEKHSDPCVHLLLLSVSASGNGEGLVLMEKAWRSWSA